MIPFFLSDKLFQLFIRYFSLSVVFLILFSLWGEYRYYDYFNINIINICDLPELLFTERAMFTSEKLTVALATPILIFLVHVLYCWMSDVFGHKLCHRVFFFSLLVLNVSIFLSIFQPLISLFPLIFLILNLLVLWLVLFQIKRFHGRGIQIHIFITMCIYLFVTGFKRIQQDFIWHLNRQPREIKTVTEQQSTSFNAPLILVGSTENLDIFYDAVNRRGIIYPKTNQ